MLWVGDAFETLTKWMPREMATLVGMANYKILIYQNINTSSNHLYHLEVFPVGKSDITVFP